MTSDPTGNAYTQKEKTMRYGEDYWTPAEVEDGRAPHNAVWDPASGVYREVIEDDAGDDDDLLPHSPRLPADEEDNPNEGL